MTDAGEVTYRPQHIRALWFLVGLGAAGTSAAVLSAAYRGALDLWSGIGLLPTLIGVVALRNVTRRVTADAYGLRSRTWLRRRSVPWSDVADLCVRVSYANNSRVEDVRCVVLVRRDGHRVPLPLPVSRMSYDPDFDAELDALRALHRRFGAPESDHLPVVSYRTAGRGPAGPLSLCTLLLVCAGIAVSYVPDATSYARAWEAAVPCTVETPAGERDACLTAVPAVIARTDADAPRKRNYLYFTGNRPMERLEVSYDAARDFEAGERVELTFWRGSVMKVAGERHVWRDNAVGGGEVAVVAVVFALVAGYPGALVVQLRTRGRRLPDDEVLPSALPFAGALAGTALWLLPLCYLHPTTVFSSPTTITWAAAGSSVTLALFGWAWRATRIRTPEVAEAVEEFAGQEDDEEVFLVARFLEHTDYSPLGFGTHIVLGGGPLAVSPHSGPGRYAAKRIPVERLTVRRVRRVRGGDAKTVPGSWHIAELDDAGTPVRLAAAPADLARVVRALRSAKTAVRTRAGGGSGV
ncbi:PH domain-containing protein [Streptomyces sp. NPDC052051]|uniref:PH domain-containing protein n=1 Tax=Streptomyces sp. NPDC052051 TaxID=3154649 RepID=UPI0034341152